MRHYVAVCTKQNLQICTLHNIFTSGDIQSAQIQGILHWTLAQGDCIQNNKAHLWKVPSSCQHHHQRQARVPSDDREREQEECWTEHFREILNRPLSEEDDDVLEADDLDINRPLPEEGADIPEAADDLDINTEVPEKEEIIKAIKSLREW